MNISKYNGDEYIFHYTKYDTAINFILKNSNIRLSSLSKVRDPLENKKFHLGYKYMPRYKDFKPPKYFLDFDIMEADSIIEKHILEYSKIVCFCRNDNNFKLHGYQKSRMWEQYADLHSGVCLIFEKEELTKNTLTIKEENLIGIVNYIDLNKKRYPSIEDYHTRKYRIKSKHNFIFIKPILEELLFEKDLDYRDENEFRIVVVDKNNEYVYLSIENALKAIIIGCNLNRTKKGLINDYCFHKNITCFEQVVLNRKSYYID